MIFILLYTMSSKSRIRKPKSNIIIEQGNIIDDKKGTIGDEVKVKKSDDDDVIGCRLYESM